MEKDQILCFLEWLSPRVHVCFSINDRFRVLHGPFLTGKCTIRFLLVRPRQVDGNFLENHGALESLR